MEKQLYFACFVLVLNQSTSAYKIDSEHTREYTKLFPVCKGGILQVTVKTIEFLLSFILRLISANFRLKVPKIAENCTLVSC